MGTISGLPHSWLYGLPGTPGDPTMRPPPYSCFPQLVQAQYAKAKCSRQEEVLDRHSRRVEDALKLRDVQPEDGHAERKGDSGEQEKILRAFVECRWMLKDR